MDAVEAIGEIVGVIRRHDGEAVDDLNRIVEIVATVPEVADEVKVGVDLPRTAHGEEFIGAGDEVVITDDSTEGVQSGTIGVLMDVEGDEAAIRLSDGSVTYRPYGLLAHPDSPQAEAWALYGSR